MEDDRLRLPYSDDLVYLRGASQEWIVRLAEALTAAGIPHHVKGDAHVSYSPRGSKNTSWSWSLYVDPRYEAAAQAVDREIETEYAGEYLEEVDEADAPSFDEPDAAYSPEEKAVIRRSNSVWTVAFVLLALAFVFGVVASRSGSGLWWTACVAAILGAVELRRLSKRIRGSL